MEPPVHERIRQAVTENRHRFTFHAERELAIDNLCAIDAESAVLTGTLKRTEPDDPERPGPRYTVVGLGTDLLTKVGVVCRFEDGGDSLLIVTCYEFKE